MKHILQLKCNLDNYFMSSWCSALARLMFQAYWIEGLLILQCTQKSPMEVFFYFYQMWEQGRSSLNLSSWQPWWLSVSPFTLFGRRGEATTSASWSPSCLVLFSCLWSLLLYRYDSCFYKVMTIHKMVHFVVFDHLVIGFSNMKRVRWAAWNDDCHCYFNHNIFVSCRHLGLIGLFFVLSRGAMTSVLTRCNLKFFANILHSVSSMYHICATLHASLFYTSHCHWWHRCFAKLDAVTVPSR